VCPPSTNQICIGEGWQRVSSACQRAAACTPASCSCCPDPPQQIRRAGCPASHASRPPTQKDGFTRNRTRPTTKYHPFLLPKKHTETAGNDGWDFQYAEKKGGKIRPAGTISHEGMRTCKRRQVPTRFCSYEKYTLLLDYKTRGSKTWAAMHFLAKSAQRYAQTRAAPA
jgi:hypothetical protein